MRYASAAYGWKMINKLFFDLEIESTPVGNIAVLNAEMLKTHTKIPVEDLIMYQWDSDNVFLPAHYLAVDKAYKTIVVAIRGTMDIADVINDLVCEYVTYDGGETHSGFLLCAQGIYKNVKDDLIELHKKYPEYEISVVGHSLGAGTATLLTCLIDVENEGFNPHCYAFGPPGIFDLETASSDRMKKLVTSYVCGDDIVCRLSHGHMRETKSAAAWFVRNKPKNAAVVTNLIKEQLLRFKTDPPPENEMKKLDPSKLTYYHYPKLYPVGDIKYLKMKVPSTTSNPSSTDDLINTANDAVKQRTAQQNATIDKFGDGDATPEPEKSDVEVSGSRGRGIFARIGYWYTSFFAKFGKRATKIDKHSGERVDVVDIVVIGNVESKDFGQMVLSRNMLMHHMPWVYEQALIKSIESISSNTSSESSQPSEEGLDKEGVEELKEVAKDAIEN
ncbi:hypothetical protein SARC_05253 [Sphaeroforma arctica JP610]|uniref:sn-1-specific diacylglycerol lipase n=1 Tax=Sphaeroforma arctica JP610 TaxID=667725 RepID=A0A0L0G0V4_9EUKA|nr:hypothetical protein SARC_05253 [Sphaeroforma arctica JP610]KNC82461.1 hypothetical protein SARC_05253 [Sphaeroforma arctica JP610]|eukprot:XP_014156363.1 hypothetical protein SARC_05253 [Sphaeroforma arctica JP610]